MKTIKHIFFISICLLFSFKLSAQDGEKLFKAKCNTCHMIGKDGTGPNLAGKKQQWIDAGEGELIYEWVTNSLTLIGSGKSTMAAAAKSFSATDMPPQPVSKEEIDAILDYVDNYVEPTETPDANPSGEPTVVYVPNYEENLTLFYFLVILLLVQIAVIFAISNSMKSFIKLKSTKDKINNGRVKNILLLLMFTGLAGSASALSFTQPGATTEKTPWLIVENNDIILLVILNITLLFVILHFKRLFMDIAKMVRPQKEKKLSARSQRRMQKLLTDAVPIEQEETIMLDHEYDGIRELDNNLPPWWVWMFYATIVFSVIYIFNYHIFKISDLQIEEYNKSMKQAELDVNAYLSEMAMNVDETNATLMTDEGDLSTGKVLFDANCVVCHNPKGEGNIGPNLTDKNWIYGFDVKDIFKTVKYGTANGMPEHNSKLNPIQLQQVSSYVLSLPEVKGKPEEGTIIEE